MLEMLYIKIVACQLRGFIVTHLPSVSYVTWFLFFFFFNLVLFRTNYVAFIPPPPRNINVDELIALHYVCKRMEWPFFSPREEPYNWVLNCCISTFSICFQIPKFKVSLTLQGKAVLLCKILSLFYKVRNSLHFWGSPVPLTFLESYFQVQLCPEPH